MNNYPQIYPVNSTLKFFFFGFQLQLNKKQYITGKYAKHFNISKHQLAFSQMKKSQADNYEVYAMRKSRCYMPL